MDKESRTEIIGIRVSKYEKDLIKKLCIEKGYRTVSDCIRSILKKSLV